jgi:uncharacterized secreted repeat protein (TIGR03808 family)
MGIDRRRVFAALAGLGAVGAATDVRAAAARDAPSRAELDAVALGLRPNAPDDQSQIFQRAIEQAAAARAILRLPPGFYRAGALQLPPYAAIKGVAGATRIVMAGGPSMMSATGSDHVAVTGIVLDGAGIPLPERRGLLHVTQGRAIRVADCEIVSSGRNGVSLESVEGEVNANTISGGDAAIFSIDARGLKISGNTIRGPGNGGILVWRSAPGDDGTLIVDNRIEGVMNKAGGSGQWGKRRQRLSRRQCDRARQPHSQCRFHGGARQCRLESADRRQYLQRPRRSCPLRRVRF